MKYTIRHQKTRSFQDALVNFIHHRGGSDEEFWALRDVSFDVPAGGTLGIVGQNGSGKSTILKLITRIIEPTTGTIDVSGQVAALIELGAGFHPDLTGRENIYLNGSILGIGRREMDRLYEEIVEFSELERFIDTPVKHYSSGMHARLGFSVAITVDPDILILDEVLSVGDQAFQTKCIAKIHEFRRRGKTILFVSHGLESVRALCDRAVWLAHGEVKALGQVDEVIGRYLDSDATPDSGISSDQNDRMNDLFMISSPREASALPVVPALSSSNGATTPSIDREFEITAIRIVDGADVERSSFESDAKVSIEFEYVAHSRLTGAVVGLRMRSADGICVCGATTLTDRVATADLGRTGVLRLTFNELALVAGSYVLDVVTRTASQKVSHYWPNCGSITITSVGHDVGVYRPRHLWTSLVATR